VLRSSRSNTRELAFFGLLGFGSSLCLGDTRLFLGCGSHSLCLLLLGLLLETKLVFPVDLWRVCDGVDLLELLNNLCRLKNDFCYVRETWQSNKGAGVAQQGLRNWLYLEVCLDSMLLC